MEEFCNFNVPAAAFRGLANKASPASSPVSYTHLDVYKRQAWAYARLGDVFTQRVPAELIQAGVKAESDADVYISSYNIYMGHVLNAKGQKLFPEDKILLRCV